MESWPRKHLITVDEYRKMAEVGLLAPDARVELIEGEIIDMAPISNLHASVLNQLNRLLVIAIGNKAIVQPQGPILFNNHSMVHPDLALLEWNRTFYSAGPPMPMDTLLVVEVSDGTVAHDRQTKIPLYARHGIPEAWIVDLQELALRVYRSPLRSGYQDEQVTKKLGIIHPVKLPDVGIDLSDLLTP